MGDGGRGVAPFYSGGEVVERRGGGGGEVLAGGKRVRCNGGGNARD
jgi:hypothetical protein